MTDTIPFSYQTLVMYLEVHPRVFIWHPVGEHSGERTYLHADEYGRLWFKRSDGRSLFLPIRGSCPISGFPLELGFRSDGFTVAMTGQKILVEFMPEVPRAA